MKTFDESVRVVMICKPDDPDGLAHVKQLQEAFMHDIASNQIVLMAASQLTEQTTCAIAAMPEMSEGDLQLGMDQIMMTSFLTSLMWGVAIGREMERVDLVIPV